MSNQFKPFVGSLLPLLIFKKFATLPADIWASPFIYFQENFQPPCFFTYLLRWKIRSYPLIKFEEAYSFIRASPFIRDLRVIKALLSISFSDILVKIWGKGLQPSSDGTAVIFMSRNDELSKLFAEMFSGQVWTFKKPFLDYRQPQTKDFSKLLMYTQIINVSFATAPDMSN